jgi:PEGA domain
MKSRMRCLRGASAIAVALILSASPVAAQEPAPSAPASEARTHFDRGVTFYNESDYPAALVEFKRAYTLVPTWQVLFNIGQSYFQNRNYAQAFVTLSRFLDEGKDRVPEGRRAIVEAERADLANRVGHANITSNRAGATITIDDEDAGVTPLRAPTLVSVGVRKVRAAAPGAPPVEQDVSVAAGDTVEVRLDFPELAPATPTPVPAPAPLVARTSAPPSAPSTSHAPALAAFGVAVAGAAAGAIFGGMVLRDKSRLDAECTQKACSPGSQPDINDVSRDGLLSTVGFGVAALGVVVGTVLWITAGHPSSGELAAPQVGPVRVGAGLVGGSF